MKRTVFSGSRSMRGILIGSALSDGALRSVPDKESFLITDRGRELASSCASISFDEGEEFKIGCDRLIYVFSKIYRRG